MADPNEVLHHVNDPLTGIGGGDAGTWGNPGEPDSMQSPARIPPSAFDYSAGVIVGIPGTEADAVPGVEHPILLRRQTDVPPSYEVAHEATHRRYEPPFTVAIAQAAAGFTQLAPPRVGLHYVKMIACFITLDAAGTVKFVQGSMDGTQTADVMGAVAVGGAAAPPLQLPPAQIETPWFFTSPDQALGLFTTVGKASGFVTLCYSPYDN